MKDNKFFLNTALAACLGVILLIAVMVRTFLPQVIIPRLDIPNMVLISLIALLADHYLAPDTKRCWISIFLLGGASFGLLPFAACFVGIDPALKLALVGAVVFTVTTLLFTTIQERLSSGPAAKAAPFLSALGLYLAAQCFMGIL